MAQVLLVEDDAELRRTLTDLLVDSGYEVTAVGDGRAAIAALSTLRRPCCVVLDLVLPLVDGWEVMRAVRASGQLVPVLVISGSARAGEAGSDAILEKPFGVDDFLRRIAHLLTVD